MAGIMDLSSSICSLIDQYIRESLPSLISAHMQTLVQVPIQNYHEKDLPSNSKNDNVVLNQFVPPPQAMQDPLLGKASYKQALTPSSRDIETLSPMVAIRKGDYFLIKVDDILVQKEVQQLQNSLIKRITLASGDNPYLLDDLTSKLGHI